MELCSACGARLQGGDPPLERSADHRMGGAFSPFPGIASGIPEIVHVDGDADPTETTSESDATAAEAPLEPEEPEDDDLEELRANYRQRSDRLWGGLMRVVQVVLGIGFVLWLLSRWFGL